MQVMTRSDTGEMHAVLVDDAVPAVWAASEACQDELGDHLATVRTAVSPLPFAASCCGIQTRDVPLHNLTEATIAVALALLTLSMRASRGVQLGIARMALEPLAMLCAVCQHGTQDVLMLPLHPLLKQVPAEDAIAALQRQVITAVNQVGLCCCCLTLSCARLMCKVQSLHVAQLQVPRQDLPKVQALQVGVDVNKAVEHPWLGEQLSFVAGLGPRKAAALLRALQRTRGADSRKAVWQTGALGDRIFRCSASCHCDART